MDTLIEELEQSTKGERMKQDPVRFEAPAPTKKHKLWLALTGGLLLAAAVGTYAYFHYRYRVSTDDAQVDAHIAPIAPKISGNIVEILVNDNQQVKTGDVLFRIDPRDYQARVDQARAALAAAQSQATGARTAVPWTSATTASGTAAAEAQLAAASADYERLKVDYERASSSEIALAQADVEAKRATAERAKADLTRMEPLAAKDEISKLQFDSYKAAARVADSDLAAAQQKVVNAERQAQSSKADAAAASARVNAAQANVEQAKANRQQVQISSAQAGSASAAILQAKANLEAAELQLSYATIVAPIDGIVTKKNVQLGQIVQPGQSLLTIVPTQDVWVTANFKETQLANVQPGQRAEIYVDMYGRSFEGTVDSVASATGSKLSLLPPENATGNFVKIVQRIPVKITIKDAPAQFVFRPGMNVDATILTQ
jgi:membrane fusion protein (multidrug efflux system)